MLRKIGAFIAALLAWTLSASIVNRMLRYGLPGYAAAEPTMTFSLSMQFARLALGALASVLAGYVATWLAPAAVRLPLIAGVVVLLLFLPVHYSLWSKFPIWYHLFFLGTLVPFFMLGSRLRRVKAA